MDSDDDCLELFSVLHQVFSPSFPLDVLHDAVLDDRPRVPSFLGEVSCQFGSEGRLHSCSFDLAKSIERSLHHEAQIVLHEQLRDTALPPLLLAYGE